MSPSVQIETDGGAELTIAAMDKYARSEIGRKTYLFVRRMMQNPEYRQMIQTRAEQIRREQQAAAG